jgi:hypothetical protein
MPDELDSLIERTLARDAEATRSRFAAVPDLRLTSKLALTTASRGLLGSLASKLALYVGVAIVVGGAVYLLPKLNEQPATSVTTPLPVTHQQTPTISEHANSAISSKPADAPLPLKGQEQATLHKISTAPSQPMKLDEGDDKNIKKIVDKNYLAPLK